MGGIDGVNRTEIMKSTQAPVVCVERDLTQALRRRELHIMAPPLFVKGWAVCELALSMWQNT